MCEPTTIMFALAAAGALANHEDQRQNVKAQTETIETNAKLEQNDLARQGDQQRVAAAAQMNEQARAAQKDMALFDTVSGEYGGGGSVDRARGVATIQNGERLATISSNSQNTLNENSFSTLASRTQASGRLASLQRPSGLQLGLQIASAGVGAYGQYKTNQRLTKQPTTPR